MREYVEAVWGWDEEFQTHFFDKYFDPDGERQIIQVDGADVGWIEVWDRPKEIILASIRVLPEWQGQGIGTAVIRSVTGQATQAAKPVALYVLKVNERAMRLYQREGFRVVRETDKHFRMVWEPTLPSPDAMDPTG